MHPEEGMPFRTRSKRKTACFERVNLEPPGLPEDGPGITKSLVCPEIMKYLPANGADHDEDQIMWHPITLLYRNDRVEEFLRSFYFLRNAFPLCLTNIK